MANNNEAAVNTKARARIHLLTECAILTALLCICSPITIPIGIIPVSMGVFAVMLTGIILGPKKGLISVFVYLLIGLCGVPLFSGGKSGFAAFAGPTGGYIWSYLFMVVIIGLLCKAVVRNRLQSVIVAVIACVIGLLVCYLCGTFQFTLVSGYSWEDALAVCVYPFVPFDILKAVCASSLGVSVRNALMSAGYLR